MLIKASNTFSSTKIVLTLYISLFSLLLFFITNKSILFAVTYNQKFSRIMRTLIKYFLYSYAHQYQNKSLFY